MNMNKCHYRPACRTRDPFIFIVIINTNNLNISFKPGFLWFLSFNVLCLDRCLAQGVIRGMDKAGRLEAHACDPHNYARMQLFNGVTINVPAGFSSF